MVAELLSQLKRQFYPSENNRHSFYLYYENPGHTLLTKIAAELPSIEHIFTETSRLVPLFIYTAHSYHVITETKVSKHCHNFVLYVSRCLPSVMLIVFLLPRPFLQRQFVQKCLKVARNFENLHEYNNGFTAEFINRRSVAT